MSLRSAAKTLLVLALAMPVVSAVLKWLEGLLIAMGDADGATIVRHVGTVCQVTWVVALVGLVIVIGLVVVNEGSQEPRVESEIRRGESREPEED